VATNPHIPNRGRGWRPNHNEGEGSSQPTQSHVDDSTQYLNYQDRLHNATNGGYDAQLFDDVVEGDDIQHHGEDEVVEPDEDAFAAEIAPHQLPDLPPFSGGPEDLFVLSSFASHIALPLWYNANNVSVIYFILFCIRNFINYINT